MFEKYLSLLPYNPSLIHQVGFYGRRMRQEAAIRRTGMFFIVLSFAVQFFAVLAPPTSAASGPNNNLLQNGYSSVSDATAKCNANDQDYKVILANYDISCADVSGAAVTAINSTDYSRQLFSMGRFSYPSVDGNQPVTISGNTNYGSTYWVRHLWGWDTTSTSSRYPAIKVKAGDGTYYWLLNGCGNLVSVGVPKAYTPPTTPVVLPPIPSTPTPPYLLLTKTTLAGYPAANSQVSPGTNLGYRIYMGNYGGQASSVNLKDVLPNNTNFVSQSLNGGAKVHTYDASTRTVEYSWDTIPADIIGNGQYYVDVVTKVAPSATNGEKICNKASVTASGNNNDTSNEVCVTVVISPTPPPVTTTTTTAPPTTTPPVTTPITTPVTPTPTPAPIPVTVPACLYDTSLPATSPDCKVCQSGTTTTDTLSCVAASKTAANQTENIADANNTTAQPGDVIVYTLTAKNYAKATVSQYAFQENIGDVLVYADPTDLHGGTLDSSTGAVTWPAVDIPAGGSASEQVTVKVKNPIPSAPVDPTDQGQYDLTMTNVFGNTVNVKVPAPSTQAIVNTAASLPNTGPGTDLFIFAGIMLVGGYFYSRARLLAHESALAVKDASIG